MMDMDMTSELQQEQQMAVRISPRLIAANHILELSSMELQEVMKQEVDETTAQEAMVIVEHKEDLHPQIIIADEKGDATANYPIPSGAHIVVNEGDRIRVNTETGEYQSRV